MYTITCHHLERTYANHGQHCEQILAYTLTGEVRKHNALPFYMGSDIPEFSMSVKSSGATLASAKSLSATTYMEQIEEFFNRTPSHLFAYVAEDETAYVMNAVEFKDFVLAFTSFQRESTSNGGAMKVRFLKESKRMVRYLQEHLL